MVAAVFIAEMQNEDNTNSSVESTYTSSTDSESSSFNTKNNKLGNARNYQSSLYGTDEEKEVLNEKSYLLN